MRTSIALFTRDLRVHDNPALHAAAHADDVIPLFVLDERILGSSYNQSNRAAFLADSLHELDRALRDRGGRLVVRRGELVEEVGRLAEHYRVDEVHLAADVSGYAHRREDALRERVSNRAKLVVHDTAITALAAGAVTPTGNKNHFAVFTPYHRRWAETAKRTLLGEPRKLRLPKDIQVGQVPSRRDIRDGDTAPGLAAGGERAGWELARTWLDGPIAGYGQGQDDMAAEGTSRLSPHLHFGTVSVTALIDAVDERAPGGQAFVRQLAWRDFHHQVLAARPDAATANYRDKGDRWRHDEQEIEVWQQGRTGFPIVDAGMRQLLAEGWMHNRARLIAGSFLTKTLYVDWRVGARHFLRHLVDGDIANNQLNWQWVAGTGTDTRPNRVLNPIAQAHRYDPDGEFVRRYVPELADIAGASVHEPWRLPAAERRQLGYPERIVDLPTATTRFLTARGKK